MNSLPDHIDADSSRQLLDLVTADPRLSRAWALVQSPSVRALSIDIFDTLLWRVVPEPAQTFVLLGSRLRDKGWLDNGLTPTMFARLRRAAERRARAGSLVTRGTPECRLAEIWDELDKLRFRVGKDELIETELTLEQNVCRLDKGVAALVELTKNLLDKRVVAISDTYLSAVELERLVAHVAGDTFPLSLWAASSDYGVNKSSGLFEAVLGVTGLEPFELVHIGDNAIADVDAPMAVGVSGVWYEKGNDVLDVMLRAERAIGVELGDTGAIDPVLGDQGLSAVRARAAQLPVAHLEESLASFWRSGSTVFGPAFTGFGDWIHERARVHGAQQVFCLMREGEFLDGLIKGAAEGASNPVASQPLWLSRQVCALASITTANRAELAAFLVRRKPSDVKGLLEQLGVDAALLPGLTEVLSAPLNAPGIADRLLDALDSAPIARAQVIATARVLRTQLLAHLGSQLPASGPVVLVDVGWGGTIQSLLSKLLEGDGQRRTVIGLYLMTQAVAEERRLDGLVLEGFLASGGEPHDRLTPVLRTPEVLEQITMSDVGTMVGFHADGSVRTAAVLMPRWQVAQKDAVQQGVFAFQRLWRSYACASALSLTGEHARGLMLTQISRMVTRPTVAEALDFGGWLHDDNFGDEGSSAIVDTNTLERARYSSPAGLAGLNMRQGYWPVGAARLVDAGLAASVGLIAEGHVDAAMASSLSELGPVAVYVDEGADFMAGAKDLVEPFAGPQGRVLVRSEQPVERAQRIRLDFSARHMLIRFDSVSVTVHSYAQRHPYSLRLGAAELVGDATFTHDARWLAPGLLEVTGGDPFYALDLQVLLPDAVARAYLVEVELNLGVLPVFGQPPVAQVEPETIVEVREVPVPVRPAWERAARAAARAARAH